ncbi:MAG: inositol monophosphatase [candidate division KSB1 bacterium]|nr:inositol monophosphatase [candidate division KSB1 bacterium]
MEYQKLLDVATAAAQVGGEVLLTFAKRHDTLLVDPKAEFDFVTEADRAAEEKIVAQILGAFPAHQIVAEEQTYPSLPQHAAPSSTGHPTPKANEVVQWIIDPLDGTTNYIHGVPNFAVSIAAKQGSKIVVGVIWDPVRRELFTTTAGGGAFLNGAPIQVSQNTNLRDCLLATGFPFRAKPRIDSYLRMFRKFFDSARDIRRMGAASLDLAYVAAGRFDGFWEYGLSPWDFAAGSLLIREAGGMVSGFDDDEDFWKTGNILASNGRLHRTMREMILSAMP